MHYGSVAKQGEFFHIFLQEEYLGIWKKENFSQLLVSVVLAMFYALKLLAK